MDAYEAQQGTTNVNREFAPVLFQTVDARQMTLVTQDFTVTAQSGLAGIVPMYSIGVDAPPRGFVPELSVVGLGGVPSPISGSPLDPLLANPFDAATFVRNAAGIGEP